VRSHFVFKHALEPTSLLLLQSAAHGAAFEKQKALLTSSEYENACALKRPSQQKECKKMR
jgi:hypothetical protein